MVDSHGGLGPPVFRHAALIVDSDDSVRRRLVPAVCRSLDMDEPVLMVVSGRTERVVRAAVGERGSRLRWGGPAGYTQRLGFVFGGFHRLLADQHAKGRPVHVVAEPEIVASADPASPVDRAAAYLSYESVCNEAFAGFGCPVTCVWDGRRHPTVVIEGVRSLHRYEITDDGYTVNDRYISTADYLAGRYQIPLGPVPAPVDRDLTLTALAEIPLLREVLRTWASEQGFAAGAGDEVVTASAEIAVNGLVHGAPPVRVRAWCRAGTLVVQVDDAGARSIDPSAGYLPPGTDPGTPRGLWLARQLADVVTIHTSATATGVRLHFPHDLTHHHP